MSFLTMDLELQPYKGLNDGRVRLQWKDPVPPTKWKKASIMSNGHQVKRSPRHYSEHARCRHCEVSSTGRCRRHPRSPRKDAPRKSLPQYAFMRRDADYEDLVHEIWHDQITRGWPKAIPYTTKQGINVAVRQCVSFIYTDDSAYYILLCGGIIGYTSARQDRVNMKTLPRLFHKMRVRAVQALRSDIAGLDEGIPSDALLAAILSFALQETVYDNEIGDEPQWPKSPLARAQLLNWVGGLPRQSAHLEAFYQLLERRGGLETITDPGLRRLLSICDLLTSSVSATSPRYPPLGSKDTAISTMELDTEASTLHQQFASRFKNFSLLSWQFLEPLFELLPDLRDVTVAVDMHHRTKGQQPQLNHLVDFANSVHWRALSLCDRIPETPGKCSCTPADSSAGEDQNEDHIMMSTIVKQTLEPVRLAVLIFSNLVIFPVTFCAGVGANLASSLRDLYENHQVRVFETELEMWVLAMGCLASWGTNDRAWFLKKLKQTTDTLCSVKSEDGGAEASLSVFLEIMRGFLWWEHVCLMPMEEVWAEMYDR